jgi:putative SbcD/Mre11-related phosphoesterase
VYPIYHHAALILEYEDRIKNKKKSYLILSDLHMGFEHEFIKKGIIINSNMILNNILNDINEIAKIQKIDGIIILGDIKSSISEITPIEWNIIPTFLEQLSKNTDVLIIPGNHDANLNRLIPESIITCNSSGLVIDDTLLIHGHSLPNKVKTNINKIIMGHIHPVFVDPKSTVHGKRLWIYLKVKKESLYGLQKKGILEIIIVPTFNKYFYSSSPQPRSSRISISPIINLLNNQNAILSSLIYTLEGSIIGDLTKIKNFY